MNAAAYVLTHEQWTTRSLIEILRSLRVRLALSLSVAVLASALSVVYVKDLNRRSVSDLQIAQHQRDELQTEWSQLLLEQSTWSTQALIQKVAQEKMGMEVPPPDKMIMVKM